MRLTATSFLPLLALLAALPSTPAAAGTVLKWQETYRHDDQPAHRAVVAFSSAAGLRIQMLEIGTGIDNSVLLYLPSRQTLYIREGKRDWVIVTPKVIEDLRARARPNTKKGPAPPITVKTTGTRHTESSFPCEGYTLQQKGMPTRIVCLSDPAAIKIDETTRRNFREMSRTLIAFMQAAGDAGAGPPKAEEGIRFNTYDMPGGFPVRVWESRRGETWIDSQLVSVTQEETPASLFEPPPPKDAPAASPRPTSP